MLGVYGHYFGRSYFRERKETNAFGHLIPIALVLIAEIIGQWLKVILRKNLSSNQHICSDIDSKENHQGEIF